jgi:hypothetical protein
MLPKTKAAIKKYGPLNTSHKRKIITDVCPKK